MPILGRRRLLWPQTYHLVKAGGTSFAGLGDIASSNTYGYWGLRAFSFATIGNNVVRLRRTSDDAESNFVSLADGSLDVASIATFINATTGFVKTLYDQSGANKANPTGPIDATQTDHTKQPQLILNGVSTRPVMRFTGAEFLVSTDLVSDPAQPYSVPYLAMRPGSASGSFGITVSDEAVDFQSGYSNSANTGFIYAGALDTQTVSDDAWHAVAHLYNGSSSNFEVDGTAHTGKVAGSQAVSGAGPFYLGSAGGTNNFIGDMFEAGFWEADKSANFAAWSANQLAWIA